MKGVSGLEGLTPRYKHMVSESSVPFWKFPRKKHISLNLPLQNLDYSKIVLIFAPSIND